MTFGLVKTHVYNDLLRNVTQLRVTREVTQFLLTFGFVHTHTERERERGDKKAAQVIPQHHCFLKIKYKFLPGKSMSR